jgi:hypothetical protein
LPEDLLEVNWSLMFLKTQRRIVLLNRRRSRSVFLHGLPISIHKGFLDLEFADGRFAVCLLVILTNLLALFLLLHLEAQLNEVVTSLLPPALKGVSGYVKVDVVLTAVIPNKPCQRDHKQKEDVVPCIAGGFGFEMAVQGFCTGESKQRSEDKLSVFELSHFITKQIETCMLTCAILLKKIFLLVSCN